MHILVLNTRGEGYEGLSPVVVCLFVFAFIFWKKAYSLHAASFTGHVVRGYAWWMLKGGGAGFVLLVARSYDIRFMAVNMPPCTGLETIADQLFDLPTWQGMRSSLTVTAHSCAFRTELWSWQSCASRFVYGNAGTVESGGLWVTPQRQSHRAGKWESYEWAADFRVHASSNRLCRQASTLQSAAGILELGDNCPPHLKPSVVDTMTPSSQPPSARNRGRVFGGFAQEDEWHRPSFW